MQGRGRHKRKVYRGRVDISGEESMQKGVGGLDKGGEERRTEKG